ncbi:MAG: PIN domain-containing protein [Thermoanaerobaculia bacterium]
MKGLDSNLLVRFATRDDPAQAEMVQQLMARAEAAGERFHLSTPVLCELVWVLSGRRYNLHREAVARVLETILAIPLFEVQERRLAILALAEFREGPGDFADYLLSWIDRAAGCDATLTFDTELKSCSRFHVLDV